MLASGFEVEQCIGDLVTVMEDTKLFYDALRRYGLVRENSLGMKNIYQFENETDMTQISQMRSTLKKRAMNNPDRRMAIFYAFAGHGIQIDGQQYVIVNEFVPKQGFYRMWNTEDDIRVMSTKYPNTFSVAVYACCREIYSVKKHTGHIGGTKDEAKAHYILVLTKENEALEAQVANSLEIMALKFTIDQQAAKLSQMQAQEDEKLKNIGK